MNFSRQSLLGAAMLLGGGVMLFAMIQQTPSTTTNDAKKIEKAQLEEVVTLTAVDENGQELEKLEVKPLTTDIATESKILEEKQKQREARVKAQEIQAQNFIKEQEKAAASALAKTRRENEQFKQKAKTEQKQADEPISRPKIATRQTQTATSKTTDNTNKNDQATKKSKPTPTSKKHPPKHPVTYYAQKGDGLIKLSKEYNIPLEVLAEANNMHILEDLMYGQKLTIPSQAQIAKIEKSVKKSQAKRKAEITAKKKAEEKKRQDAEKKRKAKQEAAIKAKQQKDAEKKRKEQEKNKSANSKRSADKKLSEARKTVKKENAKGTFGVQVALASDQEMADKVVQKFRKAGYKVKTSQTSRGVRVIVGPERGKIAALALKDKINGDPKVGVNNAWVLYWR